MAQVSQDLWTTYTRSGASSTRVLGHILNYAHVKLSSTQYSHCQFYKYSHIPQFLIFFSMIVQAHFHFIRNNAYNSYNLYICYANILVVTLFLNTNISDPKFHYICNPAQILGIFHIEIQRG